MSEERVEEVNSNLCIVDATKVDEKHGDRMRFYAFLVFATLQVFLNYDIGAMAIMLNWIEEPYDFNKTELGALGALPYLGLVLLSPFVGTIFAYFKTQLVIAIGLIVNVIALMLFATANSKIIFFISRILIGTSQSFFIIYAPVWIDTFAPELSKNLWMAILQGSIILGVTIGYTATSFFGFTDDWSWRYSISTQAGIVLILTYLFSILPGKFVNFDPNINSDSNDVVTFTDPQSLKDLHCPQKAHSSDVVFKSHSFDCEVNQSPSLGPCSNKNIPKVQSSREISALSAVSKNASYYEWRRRSNSFYTTIKVPTHVDVDILDSTLKRIAYILKNQVFIYSCITMSSLFFEVTAIQYWMTKIAISRFDMAERVVHYIFSVISITAPVLGVIFGSYVIDFLTAHFPTRPILVNQMLLLWAIICLVSGIATLIFPCPGVLIASVSLILFFGGCILPSVTLISINCIPNYLKPTASGFCMCQYHIFGYIGGTILPGIAMHISCGYDVALYITFLAASIGVMSLFAIYIYNLVKSRKIANDE
ncbi:conserved hypothetical protein [Theileria equi strain WA]|uniref:Major facilitator superfamily (MFS) profile domain-containing protein n=1 Tax=Theileria equi strain WA TaxID=1537102 RepID=L1LC45_THEEQ|nr:conserved hypothetical protein [Theileria equi strain WA]EKX72911.1 conserved hypothetical protein [Theileria equi strain WA]|eukprot:XP_004832363.1 conserved hypothetical protein [Theileria equi strain WA]